MDLFGEALSAQDLQRGNRTGIPHTKESNEATKDETPDTITTALARLEPVPPGALAVIVVDKMSLRFPTACSMFADSTHKPFRSLTKL